MQGVEVVNKLTESKTEIFVTKFYLDFLNSTLKALNAAT